MHFRSAATEYGCGVKGDARMFQRKLRRTDDTERSRGRDHGLAEFFRGNRLLHIIFVIAFQLLHHPLPAVALIDHQPLQHAERGGRLALADVFDGAAEGWNVGEVRLLGEETADFAIRIQAGFRMAK